VCAHASSSSPWPLDHFVCLSESPCFNPPPRFPPESTIFPPFEETLSIVPILAHLGFLFSGKDILYPSVDFHPPESQTAQRFSPFFPFKTLETAKFRTRCTSTGRRLFHMQDSFFFSAPEQMLRSRIRHPPFPSTVFSNPSHVA